MLTFLGVIAYGASLFGLAIAVDKDFPLPDRVACLMLGILAALACLALAGAVA